MVDHAKLEPTQGSRAPFKSWLIRFTDPSRAPLDLQNHALRQADGDWLKFQAASGLLLMFPTPGVFSVQEVLPE